MLIISLPLRGKTNPKMSQINKNNVFQKEKDKIKKKTKLERTSLPAEDAKTRKVGKKQSSRSAQRSRKQSKFANTSIENTWAGQSAVAKFFPTELSDGEDNAEETTSQLFDFSVDSPRTDRSNKENESSYISKDHPNSSVKSSNHKNRVNIDSTSEEKSLSLWSGPESSRFDITRIIKHRPTISAMTEPDCFVPKIKTKTNVKPSKQRKINRHNCNDEHDVTRNWKRSSEVSKRHHPDPCIPMSVISERYQDQIYTPVLPEDELYRFGEVYESNLLHLIHKYLEIDTFHRVVYVGPEKGSVAARVQKYFCLINKILSVYPGKIDYTDVKDNTKLLAFKIAHVGAEDFFSQAANDEAYKKAPFHRVILHDAVQYFNNMDTTMKNLLQVLHKFGKVLIIHRPGCLNTLPYFNSARNRITDNDIPYMKIITALQKLKADVEWDLVHVPIVIPTSKWLAMLKAKYPPQMEIMSNYEITCGLRELSEGPLKYLQGSEMELEDRLMFITASLPTFDCAYPSVQRVGGASQVPYSGAADAKYYLPVTKDIQTFLEKPKTSKAQFSKSIF